MGLVDAQLLDLGHQLLGQLAHILEPQPLLERFAVEHLQGGDLVLVVGNELLEGLDHPLGLLLGEAGEDHRIEADGVDDLLVPLLDRQQQLAQLGIAERLDRRADHLRRRLAHLLVVRLADIKELLRPRLVAVGIEGLDQHRRSAP